MDLEDECNLSLHVSKTEGNAFKLYIDWCKLSQEDAQDKIKFILHDIQTLDNKENSFLIEQLTFLRLFFELNNHPDAGIIVDLFPTIIDHTKLSLFYHSPEGYSGKQSCFAANWRILKEYSQLLVVTLNQTSNRLLEVAENYKYLLLNIKHKGALSSVYESFLQILLKMVQNQKTCHIPLDWLTSLLDSLERINPTLSFTRRSGGLPFLMLALVIAEFSTNKGIIALVIDKLISVMSNTNSNNESKIHAINILRILFKDSSIGSEIMNHCEIVLCSCVDGFTAKEWSIRNGCLMLFSSLVLRIFGCNREGSTQSINQITFEMFFKKFHSKLIPLMLKELAICVRSIHRDTNLHPSLFPILSMLARLACANPIEHCQIREQFINNIIRCFFSPVLKIREIAAICLVRLISPNTLDYFVEWLLNKPLQSNNWIHSCLLFAIEVKEMKLMTENRLNTFCDKISQIQALLPYHAYLAKIKLGITQLKINTNSDIGFNLLYLCEPLKSHINCDLFCSHSDISQIKLSELIQIFNNQCTKLCMSKCLDELCRRNNYIESSLSNSYSNAQLSLSPFLFKTNSMHLICAIIRYITKFNFYFDIEEIVTIFIFYAQPEIAQEIRMEICFNLNFIVEGVVAKKISNNGYLLFLILLQDDDSLIRETTATSLSKLYSKSYSEFYCLEQILRLLIGTSTLFTHYSEELVKLNKRIELNQRNKLFEIESPNIYREFHVELNILSKNSLIFEGERETLQELIRICKPF